MERVIEAYAAAASKLIERYNAVSSPELFAPVADLLPASPARVADIGAGPGRHAAWLAGMGHAVLAVEPVGEFRDAGMAAHASTGIEWLDDRLPDLTATKGRGRFDLVLLCAVWQHLDDGQRPVAMRSLAELTAPGGRVIMSLRHGPGAPGRPVYAISADQTVNAAASAGLGLLRRVAAESVQTCNRAAGVRWTWLAFVRG